MGGGEGEEGGGEGEGKEIGRGGGEERERVEGLPGVDACEGVYGESYLASCSSI
jgi:hypothetical protein